MTLILVCLLVSAVYFIIGAGFITGARQRWPDLPALDIPSRVVLTALWLPLVAVMLLYALGKWLVLMWEA